MNNNQTSGKTFSVGRLILIILISLFVLSIFLVGIFLFVVYRHDRNNESEVLAFMKQHDMPASLDAIIPAPIPDIDNAGTLLADIRENAKVSSTILDMATPDILGRFSKNKPPSIQEISHFYSLLRKYQGKEMIILMRKFSTKPEYNANLDFDKLHHTPLPHLSALRTGARILALHAWVNTAKGNADVALSEIAAIFRISDHLMQEPTLVSIQIAIAIRKIGIYQLSEVLYWCPEKALNSPNMAEVEELLKSFPGTPGCFPELKKAFYFELICIRGINSQNIGKILQDESTALSKKVIGDRLINRETLHICQTIQAIIEACDAPWSKTRGRHQGPPMKSDFIFINSTLH